MMQNPVPALPQRLAKLGREATRKEWILMLHVLKSLPLTWRADAWSCCLPLPYSTNSYTFHQGLAVYSSIQHLPVTCMVPGPVLGAGGTTNGHPLCL